MGRVSLRKVRRFVWRGLSLGGISDGLRPLPRVGGEDPSRHDPQRGIRPPETRFSPVRHRKRQPSFTSVRVEVFSSIRPGRTWQTFPEMTVMTKKSPVPVLTNMSKNELRVWLRRPFCASPVSQSALSGLRQRRHETSLRHSRPQQPLRRRSDSRHRSQPGCLVAGMAGATRSDSIPSAAAVASQCRAKPVERRTVSGASASLRCLEHATSADSAKSRPA